jgi:hypothetical protein
VVDLVLREAEFHQATPYLEGTDGLSEVSVLQVLAETRGPVIVASTKVEGSFASEERGVMTVDVAPLDPGQRRDYRESQLMKRGVQIEGSTVEILGNRFRLGPEQIGRAVAEACGLAC